MENKLGKLWYTYPNGKRKVMVSGMTFPALQSEAKKLKQHGYRKEFFELSYVGTVKNEQRSMRECLPILECMAKRLGLPTNNGIVLKEFLNLNKK